MNLITFPRIITRPVGVAGAGGGGFGPAQTIVLQLGQNLPSDTVLYSSHPDNNYNTESLYVGESNLTTRIMRSLIKYNLENNIPPGADLLSAVLSLYLIGDLSGNARTFRAYRQLRAWVDSQATYNIFSTGNSWGTAGGFGVTDAEQTDVGSADFTATETPNTWHEFSLNVAAILEMANGTIANNGLIIKADTEADDAYTFASSAYGGVATLKPKLTLTFRPPLLQKTVYATPLIEDGTLAAWGHTVRENSTSWHHYYTYLSGGRRVIGHATSADGLSWTLDTANNPVLGLGAGGKFDAYQVWIPRVWIEGETWYMLYTGQISSTGAFAIGLATSADGVTWTRQNSGDAILAGTAGQWDADKCELATIIKVGATYYCWYNTLGTNPRRTGLATATDLLGPWTKDANNPIFDGFYQGVFCGDVFKYGGNYYYMTPRYTSGTNYAVFDLWKDDAPTFYFNERQYLGIFKNFGAEGAWDGHDQDVPCVVTDAIDRVVTDNPAYCYYSGEQQDGGDVWKTGLFTFDPSKLP